MHLNQKQPTQKTKPIIVDYISLCHLTSAVSKHDRKKNAIELCKHTRLTKQTLFLLLPAENIAGKQMHIGFVCFCTPVFLFLFMLSVSYLIPGCLPSPSLPNLFIHSLISGSAGVHTSKRVYLGNYLALSNKATTDSN